MAAALEVALACEPAEIARFASLLEEFCATHDVPQQASAPFDLAFDEVLSNIVKYAHADPAGHQIIAALRLGDGWMEGEVIDDGPAFDPLQAPEPDLTLDVDERPVGGLGVFLVRKVMDSVDYRREGGRNHVRFRRPLPPTAG